MFVPSTPDATVLAKLREYCPAFVSVADADLWVNFVNTWNRLMTLLCWNDEECGDFLSGTRTLYEVLNPDCIREQDIYLKHKKVTEITSAEIQIYDKDGSETITITDPDSFYRPAENKFKLYMNHETIQRCLNCREEAYIKIEYTAGYDEIPECFYGAICRVISQAWCEHNCIEGDCAQTDRLGLNAVLKEKSVGDRTWKWDLGDRLIEKTINNFQAKGLLAELMRFGNCTNKITFSVGAYC